MRTRGTDNWEAGAVKAYTRLKRNGGREGTGWGPPPYSRIHLSNLRWIIVFGSFRYESSTYKYP